MKPMIVKVGDATQEPVEAPHDHGWFTRRNDDTAGLGDYAVDPVKLPRGLGPLVADVRAFGLEVGIWVEPECVQHRWQEHLGSFGISNG